MKRIEYLRYLLELGVCPNNQIDEQRPTIRALHNDIPVALQLEMLKLLVEHGADVNFLFTIFGESNNLFTALDHASVPEVRDYLRSIGAKTAAELNSRQPVPLGLSDKLVQVVAHVEKLFGKSEKKSITDILSPSPIAVHIVKPVKEDGILTLFTVGLSESAMNVPPALSDHAYAELYLQLPGKWEYLNPEPRWSWPIQLLVDLASYPHANDAYFAVPVTAVTNGDPPTPLGPDVPFTSTGLVADEGFQRSDGQTVDLFCVIPLFEDEAVLARANISEFLNRLDASETSRVLDLRRHSFA